MNTVTELNWTDVHGLCTERTVIFMLLLHNSSASAS